MKRCPRCGREYDVTMMFCLDDGTELLYGPASMDEPQTAILSGSQGVGDGRLASEDATRQFGRSAEVATANSIAVLPFANISSDADNEYFCDGLAEELLNALSKIDELKVAARTSAFSFKGKNAKVKEIAEALNVSSVLEGSVRKAGERIRISVQLVNAADGYQLWSERYDREMKDIFDVQDEITLAVVDALKIKLLGAKEAELLKRHTRDPKAYEYYLRGLSHFNKWTPIDFEKAIENFERAIAIEPAYASAYAGIADAYTELAFFSFSSTSKDVGPKARDAANKALQLDDGLAEAHNSMALIKLYFDWDHRGAEDEFKRAILLNPGNAYTHMWYGWYLALMARFDESLNELQRARELDPLSAPNINAIGVAYHWSRQTDRAIAQFQEVLELYPNYAVTLSFLAEAYAQTGDIASAIATIERIQPAAWDPQSLSVMGYLYARNGDREKAFNTLSAFSDRAGREYVPAIHSAYVYAGLGEREQAFEWMERAFDEQVAWLPFLKVDIKFDSLRDDERFKDMLKKIGFTD